jgi:hypothetical protein
MNCEHAYEYQGVVTWPSADPRPGSGAHDRHYADAYVCTRCLAMRTMRERVMGNTYEKALSGAAQYEARPT